VSASPSQGTFPLTVRGVPVAGEVVKWNADGFAVWATPSDEQTYASLSGAGINADPGDLDQAGGLSITAHAASTAGFSVTNNSTTAGIAITNTAFGGLTLTDHSGFGASLVATGAGEAVIQATGTGQVQISGNAAGGVSIASGGGAVVLGEHADLIALYGGAAVVQPVAITAPAGGAVVDSESRAAIVSILNALGAAAGGIGVTA